MGRYFKRLSKILIITFVILCCLIWLLSPSIIRYAINSHGLPKPLSLTSTSSIRYNPFTAYLTISDLEIQSNEQTSELKIQSLEVELYLHQLLFDKIYVSEFTINGVFIPVTINESSFNIAGFEFKDDESNAKEIELETDTDEPSNTFPYEVIIPEFILTDAKIQLVHLAQEYNIQLDSFSLADILLSTNEQEIQLHLSSLFNGSPIEVALNAQLLQQQGKVSLDLNAKNIALNSVQAFLPASISAIDGKVSYSSKINIDINTEQTLANVNELILSIEDFHVEQDNIVIDVENQEIKAEQFVISLRPQTPINMQATLGYVINGISAKSKDNEAILADISNLSVNNIVVDYEQNIPKVNVESVQVANSKFSDNHLQDMPALAVFNQLLLNNIEYTPTLIAVNKITLSGLIANILLDKEKNLATLVVADNRSENLNLPHQESNKAHDEQEKQAAESNSANDTPKVALKLGQFILLDDAIIDFKDKSVIPHYERNVNISHLSLADIDSSKPEQEVQFDMRGKSNQYANFDIKGHGFPFAAEQKFTLDAVIKELSLPSVSSYIKEALQYEIESGQLDMTIAAALTGTQIDGDVDLLLRGVEFTAADDHEASTITDQTSMPFNVALGMLKDSDGNVELSLPLAGDTSSPSFGFSGFLTLLVKQATMSAAKDYLLTTFVPYASVMKVALAAGEFALKLRINDLNYAATETELNTEQLEFSRQMSVMLADRDDVNVKLCAIATSADIAAKSAEEVHKADNIKRLKAISQQRVDIFKAYMVKKLKVPSAKLLLCTPQVDTSPDAKSRIEFVI